MEISKHDEPDGFPHTKISTTRELTDTVDALEEESKVAVMLLKLFESGDIATADEGFFVTLSLNCIEDFALQEEPVLRLTNLALAQAEQPWRAHSVMLIDHKRVYAFRLVSFAETQNPYE